MGNLQNYQAKICLTASGCLIVNDRVLLVKHRKLNFWLNPGGHLEPNELPHLAAQREFEEETGLKVRTVNYSTLAATDDSQYLPNPISTNLHWVSRQNFASRQQAEEQQLPFSPEEKWPAGCEQHLNFIYLVEPVSGLKFSHHPEEVTDIAWFAKSKIDQLDTIDNIKQEIRLAFRLMSQIKRHGD